MELGQANTSKESKMEKVDRYCARIAQHREICTCLPLSHVLPGVSISCPATQGIPSLPPYILKIFCAPVFHSLARTPMFLVRLFFLHWVRVMLHTGTQPTAPNSVLLGPVGTRFRVDLKVLVCNMRVCANGRTISNLQRIRAVAFGRAGCLCGLFLALPVSDASLRALGR